MLTHLDAAGLSKFDMPEYFLRLDKMPLTPNGKILKRELVDKVRQGQLSPVPVRFVPPEKAQSIKLIRRHCGAGVPMGLALT